jgi:hypothetical protein
MGIKRHIAADYPRRDTVSHVRYWLVDRNAMSLLCVCMGYPALVDRPAQSTVLPFKEPRNDAGR